MALLGNLYFIGKAAIIQKFTPSCHCLYYIPHDMQTTSAFIIYIHVVGNKKDIDFYACNNFPYKAT